MQRRHIKHSHARRTIKPSFWIAILAKSGPPIMMGLII
jgi:hypothetical protein